VKEKVAIFGGSFNPPHMAHVLAIAWVLATEDVDRLLMIPTFQHPFAKPLAPDEARVRMCELAAGWLPRVTVSRVEEELGGESKTLRTLEHLRALHPEWAMRLVIGGDLVLETDKWFRFDRIQELAPPLVVGRAGFDAPGVPTALLPAVSSTEVRARAAAGEWETLRTLVPRDVLEYLRAERLYGGISEQ
jgi:nicotinate-nucleotide adenylyltransferase